VTVLLVKEILVHAELVSCCELLSCGESCKCSSSDDMHTKHEEELCQTKYCSIVVEMGKPACSLYVCANIHTSESNGLPHSV
jgi:hypothetical protein